MQKIHPDELNKMDHKTKDDVIYQMQDRLDRLEHNYENLVEHPAGKSAALRPPYGKTG